MNSLTTQVVSFCVGLLLFIAFSPAFTPVFEFFPFPLLAFLLVCAYLWVGFKWAMCEALLFGCEDRVKELRSRIVELDIEVEEPKKEDST